MVQMLTTYHSPLGALTLASNGEALIGLWLAKQKYFTETLDQQTVMNHDLPIFHQTKRWLAQYFDGQAPDIGELKLSPDGSEFRRCVWQILSEIPYGKVVTYGAVAKQVAYLMGRPSMSSQAVGGAIAHNPISIIIPCHRVISADSKLTGYAGGLKNKAYLLELEGADLTRLYPF